MKIRIVITLLLLVITSCNETQLSTWVMTGQNTDLIGRVLAERGNIAMGPVFRYETTTEIKWGPEPSAVGASFLIRTPEKDMAAQQTPIDDILATLHATPYGGFQPLVDVDGEGRHLRTDWIVGSLFSETPQADWAIALEWSKGDYSDNQWFIGGMGRF